MKGLIAKHTIWINTHFINISEIKSIQAKIINYKLRLFVTMPQLIAATCISQDADLKIDSSEWLGHILFVCDLWLKAETFLSGFEPVILVTFCFNGMLVLSTPPLFWYFPQGCILQPFPKPLKIKVITYNCILIKQIYCFLWVFFFLMVILSLKFSLYNMTLRPGI